MALSFLFSLLMNIVSIPENQDTSFQDKFESHHIPIPTSGSIDFDEL